MHTLSAAAAALGRRGGSSTSEAKRSAARTNGKLGGRPRAEYHVVRLDYGIRNSEGHHHQTHHFSTHRTLDAAVQSFLNMQKSYNCVDIVDQYGKEMEFEY